MNLKRNACARGVALPVIMTLVLMGAFSAPLHAQFANVPAINFVKPFAGANPLPQILTLASTGATFGFTTTATTSTGGNWLSVSNTNQSSCFTCFTPFHITVAVNSAVTLAVGTYNGQVVFAGGGFTMTVPITLVVESVATSFLDNLPGGMSFSFKTGSAAPPGQTIQVRTGGVAAVIPWTVAVSTSDGGNWLNASTLSGNTPATLTVTIVKSSLPGAGLIVGTFVGRLQFQTPGRGSVSVPVSVEVGDNVFQQVNPISFTKPYTGANPLSQIMTIASTGATFGFNSTSSTATGGNWLSISNTNASSCFTCFTPFPITVTINAGVTLAVGTYTGQIVLAGGGMTMIVPVTLTVGDPSTSFFDNLAGQMTFSLKTAGSAPPKQTIQIRNAGAGLLDWTVSKSTADSGNWLNVSAPNGTAPSLLDVDISVANLPNAGLVEGTFVGQIVIRSAGNSITIPVSVSVGDDVFEQVNPISFTKPQNGANPLPQLLTIASTGATFGFVSSASTATGGNWLSISNTNQSSCFTCFTPFALTVSVNAAITLAPGTYTGQVVVASGGKSMVVPVTLTVNAPDTPFLDNLPGQMTFSMKTAGLAPPGQIIQIRNGGQGTLDWTLAASTSDGGNWLTVSSPAGTAPSLTTIGITVANLPFAGLVAGKFTGQLVVRTANGSITIPVAVSVGDDVFVQVNPISFTKPQNGVNPLPQIITIASSGATFGFVSSASTATGGDWLSISNTNQSSCFTCFTPFGITVRVNPAVTLAAGTYTGQITVSGGGLSMTVPVTLTVGAPAAPFFDNVQGQMSFYTQAGAGAIPAQAIQIRNGGSGALNWTSSAATGDGGNWLQVSSASGSAPSTLTVSVVRQSLPSAGLVAGTFVGQVLLQTSGNSITVPVVVVIGPDVFIQPPSLSFSKAFGGANPLSQTINLASSGAAFGFNTVSYTGTGGSWLSVSNTNNSSCFTCFTPFSITATVNAAVTLAAGTYTGEIIFASGGMTMTVPVILSVGIQASQPASISATSGTPQSANVNSAFTGLLVATVLDGSTNPVNGVTVTFSAPGSGASGSFAGGVNTAVTNASGQATTAVFTANGTAGSYNVTATVSGVASTASFSLTNTIVSGVPGTPSSPQPADAATAASVTSSVTWSATNATSYDVYFGTAATPPFVATVTASTYNPGPLTLGTLYYWRVVAKNGVNSTSGPTWRFTTTTVNNPPPGLRFVAVPPCRVADTRGGFSGNFGPPTLTGGSTRDLPIPLSVCGIPSTAAAYSFNVTVVPQESLGYLSLWPTGQPQPLVSTLNSFHGGVVANAAIVPAGTNGSVSAFVTNRTDVILDINGYFDAVTPTGSSFYTVDPCRLADTRLGSGFSGAFGAPTPAAGSSRDFPIPGHCGVPQAAAYALNVTVVPPGPLAYLTIWPTGQAQPGVSTLNSFDGAIVANAAIVPSGTAGSVSSFVFNATDEILDINGYFGASGGANELRFQAVAPCRIADTRLPANGPIMDGGTTRNFAVAGVCNVPSDAKAYSLNVTVVPTGALAYLTLWPAGKAQPGVSTLNSFLGRVVANAALAPAGTSGAVSVFVTNQTHVILDINGYFK